jgi:hypothetical protein
LIPDDKQKKIDGKEKKTDLVKNSLNPDFNKHFMWSNMNREDLKNKSLELYLYAQDSSLKILIGAIRFNTGSNSKKKNKFWEEANEKESSVWLKVIEEKNSKNLQTFELELRNMLKKE